MEERRYALYFDGTTVPGIPLETVKSKLARLYKCEVSRLEPLFDGKPHVLKQGLSERDALYYVEMLQRAGAAAWKSSERPTPEQLAERNEQFAQLRYRVRFDGTVVTGAALPMVKQKLAELYRRDVAEIEKLFNGKAHILKHNLSDSEAEHYLRSMRRAGAVAEKIPDVPLAAPTLPPPMPIVSETADALSITEDVPPEQAPPPATVAPFSATDSSLSLVPIATEESNAGFAPSIGKPAPDDAGPPSVPAASGSRIAREQQRKTYDDETCELKWFALEGRLGRVRYLSWTFCSSLLLSLILGMTINKNTSMPHLAVSIPLYFVWLIFISGVIIRRLHDINYSGWWALLLFVPFANLVLAVLLQFRAGDPDYNDFGLPPPPNSNAVVWIAVLSVGLWVVSLLYLFANRNNIAEQEQAMIRQMEQQRGSPMTDADKEAALKLLRALQKAKER